MKIAKKGWIFTRDPAARPRKHGSVFPVMELLLLAAAIAISAGLPLRAVEKKAVLVPTYSMEIKVVCDSLDAAEKAELKFLPLPPGKMWRFPAAGMTAIRVI